MASVSEVPTNKKSQISPHYTSFHSHYSSLCDLLAGNQALILPFATHLYSQDIIAKGIHQSVQDTRNPPYERATAVLSAVETNIQFKPQVVFNEVLVGLKKVDLTLAIKGLVETFESNGGTLTDDIRDIITPSTSDSQATGNSSRQSSIDNDITEGIPDLRELMNTAAVVIGKQWKLVAIPLGFDQNEVETIAADNDEIAHDCCRDMFEQWESRAISPYLWSTLERAMKSVLKLKGMASVIERKREELQKYNSLYMDYAHLVPELCDLLELVGAEVSMKWREIGIELRLNRSTLASIGHKRRSDDTDRMIEVFSQWSSQLSSPYNWQTLLIALTVPHVNEKKLAEDVATQLKINMKQ